MDEAVDYEEICKRLIVENEVLRQRLKRAPVKVGPALARVRDFVEDNYLVVMAGLFITSMLVSALYTVYQDRRQRP